jgi:hypothetical protein
MANIEGVVAGIKGMYPRLKAFSPKERSRLSVEGKGFLLSFNLSPRDFTRYLVCSLLNPPSLAVIYRAKPEVHYCIIGHAGSVSARTYLIIDPHLLLPNEAPPGTDQSTLYLRGVAPLFFLLPIVSLNQSHPSLTHLSA